MQKKTLMHMLVLFGWLVVGADLLREKNTADQ
jgi:hypothetical protein